MAELRMQVGLLEFAPARRRRGRRDQRAVGSDGRPANVPAAGRASHAAEHPQHTPNLTSDQKQRGAERQLD